MLGLVDGDAARTNEMAVSFPRAIAGMVRGVCFRRVCCCCSRVMARWVVTEARA